MKIAMITPGYLPVPAVNGGAVEVLIEYLLDGNEKNNEMKIDCYTVENAHLEKYYYKNTKIIQIKIKKITQIINRIVNIYYKAFKIKKWRTSFSREITSKIKREKYDYVVVHNNLMAYRDIYEKTENKNNLVYVLHNIDGEDDINHVILAKLIGKTAKKVLAVSNYVKREFDRISESNISTVLYNCIDIELYSKKIANDIIIKKREELGIENNDFVFIYSGRIDVYKGVLELIKAFKKIDRKNKKLLIVGKSWFDKENKKDKYTESLMNESKDICKDVIFSGFVAPRNMPLMYQISDCIVVPSIWEEPFGVVALEGMASGLPLIVTDSGGLTEVVDEKCAFIVKKEEQLIDNLANKMKQIISEKNLVKEMGEHGRKRVIEVPEFHKDNYFNNFCQKTNIRGDNI